MCVCVCVCVCVCIHIYISFTLISFPFYLAPLLRTISLSHSPFPISFRLILISKFLVQKMVIGQILHSDLKK